MLWSRVLRARPSRCPCTQSGPFHEWRLEPCLAVSDWLYRSYTTTYIPFAPPMDSWNFDAIHRSWDVCLKKRKVLGFPACTIVLCTPWIPIPPIDWDQDGSPATGCYETYQVSLNLAQFEGLRVRRVHAVHWTENAPVQSPLKRSFRCGFLIT